MEDRADLIKREMDFLDQLRQETVKLIHHAGAPVTAGKDGMVVHDPDTGVVVRDYSLRLNAIREARALNDRLSKVLGLDSAVKVSVDTSAQAAAEEAAAVAASYLAEGGAPE